MKNEYFIDNISDETLVNLIDGTLKLEKNQKTKNNKLNILKLIPAVAAIVLIIGLMNILPNLNFQKFTPGSNTGMNGGGYFEEIELDGLKEPIVDIYSNSMVYGAIDADGKVYMWGSNIFGQLDIPENLPPIKKIGIGSYCVIALGEDGKLYGWGTNEKEAMDFLGIDGIFIDVDANGYHTAAVSSDGKVYKWGTSNMGGQEHVPVDLPPIVSVQCNVYATTVIDADGNVYKWGLNRNSIYNDDLFKNVKTKMAAVLPYDTIVLGKDGNIYGEVPRSNLNYKYKKQPDIKNIKSICGGMMNVAAIDDNGKLYIWGEYDYIPGSPSIIDIPSNLPPMEKVSISYDNMIGLGQNGKVYQWGRNSNIEYLLLNNKDLDYNYSFDGSAEVKNCDEFADALQNKIKTIYINGIVDVKTDANIYTDQEIYIMPGGVLNINTLNFFCKGDIVNDGVINVYGRLLVFKEPSKFGILNNAGLGKYTGYSGEISYYCHEITVSEIKRILNGDLPYTSISLAASQGYTLVIDEDYTLPENKTLWFNINTTLKIAKNVTFTVNGRVEAHTQIINDGEIIGDININIYK
ncbi:MAG: hypothetical protein FWF92_03705 [Oscillospiraceae bacterium]|nr:hypothetical protein [Oscillospiraceae bacterium]